MSRATRLSAVFTAAVLSLPVVVQPIRAEAQVPAPVAAAADPAQERVVTVFSGGFGQVWERRAIPPMTGPRDLALDGISRLALPESLRIAGDGGPLTVRAVSLSRNLLSYHTLLERFLGREIGVVKVHPTTGEERVEKATVLSVAGGVVLRIGERIETGMPGRLVFPNDLGDLAARPRLTATIAAGSAVKGLTLTYLSDGLGWSADYAATLSPDGKTMTLTGWASVSNDTGVDLDAGRLRLVAGQVNRVGAAQPMAKAPRLMAAESRGAAADMATALPARAEVGNLHVYTLAGGVTLATGERKQVALLGPVEVPVSERLSLQGHPLVFGVQRGETAPEQAQRRLTFVNKSLVPGGLPLPAGALRVYRPDADGVPLYAGADQLGDTPDGETADISLGRAFDVTMRREQTSFKRLDAQGRSVEAAFKLTFRNGRDEAATLRLDENLPGDWTIVAKSQDFARAAGQARFTVKVPAKGETVVTYTVRVLR